MTPGPLDLTLVWAKVKTQGTIDFGNFSTTHLIFVLY
jgi:hypothetical protein